jgi:hypothetical protein
VSCETECEKIFDDGKDSWKNVSWKSFSITSDYHQWTDQKSLFIRM